MMIWWVGWTCRQYIMLFDAGGKCGVCNFIVDFIIYRYTLGHDAMILNVKVTGSDKVRFIPDNAVKTKDIIRARTRI